MQARILIYSRRSRLDSFALFAKDVGGCGIGGIGRGFTRGRQQACSRACYNRRVGGVDGHNV